MAKRTSAKSGRNSGRGSKDRTRGRENRSKADVRAAAPTEPLSLVGLPAFSELSPSAAQLDCFLANKDSYASGIGGDAQPVMGCVVRLDRGFPVVCCEEKTGRCEFGQGLSSLKTDERVAVGDWVVAWWPEDHDMGVCDAILPRTSDIARWRGKSRGEKQTLAANVDVVVVAQALSDKPLLLDRIARSIVVALDCGATAAIVLTKADRCPDASWLASELERVRQVVGQDVRMVVTAAGPEEADADYLAQLERVALDAGCSWGVQGFLELVPTGTCGMMIGESGAGKSTLLNDVLGEDVLETGAVREADDAGRHTTVARRMVSLPHAGIMVDEPGLRSLPLVGHERGLAKAFPALAEAARGCRFSDCTHTDEPGCGVRAGFEAGEYTRPAFETYVALAREMRASADSLDPDVVI